MMKLLYDVHCMIQKFHGVYVRDTCLMRFLEFHETVSLNRTLLYFLKLVSYTSRLFANHSSAFPKVYLVFIAKHSPKGLEKGNISPLCG